MFSRERARGVHLAVQISCAHRAEYWQTSHLSRLFNSFHPRIRAVTPPWPRYTRHTPPSLPPSHPFSHPICLFLSLTAAWILCFLSYTLESFYRDCVSVLQSSAFCNDIVGKTDTLAVISGTRQQCNRHCPGVRSLENTRSLSNCVATRLNGEPMARFTENFPRRARSWVIDRARTPPNQETDCQGEPSRLILLLTLGTIKIVETGNSQF